MSWDVILLDMDGTLSDSGLGITRCAYHALTELKVETGGPETLRHFVGPPLGESFGKRYGLSPGDTERAIALFRERYRETGIHEHVPYPGIPELLRDLYDAGKQLILASSKPRIYARQILEDYGVLEYFTIVMGCELDGRFDTKTLVLEEIMRQLHADDAMKKRMVMVGDRRYDLEGAGNVGISCIAVTYGYAEPGELDGADAYAGTVDELRALLLLR